MFFVPLLWALGLLSEFFKRRYPIHFRPVVFDLLTTPNAKKYCKTQWKEKCRSMSTVIAYKEKGVFTVRRPSSDNKPGHENRAG
jgi:hypothetical protein